MDREQALAELRQIVNAAKNLGHWAAALESTLGDGLLSVQATPPAAPPKVEREEEWLNPKAAARMAGVHHTTVRRWADDEVRYPGLSKMIGGRWRISSKVLGLIIAGEPPLSSNPTKGR